MFYSNTSITFESMRAFLLHLCLLCLLLPLQAQQASSPPTNSPVQSGPMVGYAEMREVMLWVQLKQPAKVQFAYWEEGTPKTTEYRTPIVTTTHDQAFVAHCVADQVQPGKHYEARLIIDDQPITLQHPIRFQSRALWQWRGDPPAFRAAIGSCNYVNDPPYDRPGKPYGGDPSIFTAIHKSQPDLMVWLGDNIYLREADWNTRTGIHYRYTHSRSIPEMQPLLSQMHHYAIWDDHDYGPNDADRSFVHKDKTLEAFKLFWANPSYGLENSPGITTMFSWSDCDFFMLDNRFHRSNSERKDEKGTLLGQAQIDWLIDALKGSYAPFKFVCVGGMVLSTCDQYENYIHIFPEERQALLDAIQREGIKGVIFLTGDRHHTELSKWQPDGGIPIYDLTISPLTSKSYPGDGEQNKLLVKGTEVSEANYGLLEVSGPYKDRKLTIRVLDGKGKELWNREIGQKEFGAP